MDYLVIAEKITEVYKKCGITSLPFNCFQILRHYRFTIYTYTELLEKNERLYRMCVSYSKDAFKYDKIIAYNEAMYQRRINFTLMHELGHFILGHLEETAENEAAANMFASNMLAPRILIHRFGCRTVDSIYETFGLSHVASIKALADYKDWYFKISQQPAPRSPSAPELLLEKIFFSKQKKARQSKPVEVAKIITVTTPEERNDSISDEQLFEHLKSSPTERSKAAMLGLGIEEYLIYRYNFKFDRIKQPMAF